jgi:hypothetical protein
MNFKKSILKLLLSGVAVVASFSLLVATADAAPTLVPTPNPVAFGVQDIHQSVGQNNVTVEFANTSGGPITVTGGDVITGDNAADFHISTDTCSGTVVADGTPCYVYVDFTPSSVGTLEQAQLEVGTDAGESTVPLNGTGATGSLTGTSEVFTPLPYNYIQNVTSITFTNNSSYIVSPGTATVTGADASDFTVTYNGCNFLVYPASTCIVNLAFQAAAPGNYTAQLELMNDGTTNPVVIPLQATALTGPNLVVSPPKFNFGNVALNGTSPKQGFTITNTGDYPASISELLPLGGDPERFPITDNNCGNRIVLGLLLKPGESCGFQVSYHPVNPGLNNLSIYLLSTVVPTIIPLQGTGVAAPAGSVSLEGTPQVTKMLTCSPEGFPPETAFHFVWKRGTAVIKGATSGHYTLNRADTGKKVSCVLVATNSVGRQQLNAAGVKVSSLDLSGLPGSLVNEQVSRGADISGPLKAAGKPVEVDIGNPVSASDPLVLRSHARMSVSVDGSVLGKGRVVVLSPRALSRFADGTHVLGVTSKGRVSRAELTLGEAPLAAQLSGSGNAGSTVVVSSLYQLQSVVVHLPPGLEVDTGGAGLGTVQFQSAIAPTQSFALTSSGRYNGVKVTLDKHSIVVTNLSAQTGQIRFRLRPGVISGSGGVLTTVASTPESSRTTVRTAASW